MPKRNPRTIYNPDLVFSDEHAVPILELNIDKFPDGYKCDWLQLITRPTKEWLKNSKYKGRGTIWAISNPSLNFDNEWTQSVFLICQGFRESFFGYLLKEAKSELENLATCLENTVPRKFDGWTGLLHIERGRVFRCVEELEWEEV